MDGESPSATVRLGPSGGAVDLAGVAVARVGTGVLSRETEVTVAATRTDETARDWEATTPVAPGSRLATELRITLGADVPAGPVQMEVPIPSGSPSVAPFAQVLQRNANEVLDGFVRLESSVTGDTLRFTLDPEAFTRERRADGRYEAVVVLAGVG